MSEHVIHNCINSLPKDIKIIIVDNSGSKSFKETIEKKYQNVKCLVSNTNLGMGAGNNLGLKAIKTDYAFILNPDVLLEQDTIDELIKASNDIRNFGIISPISSSKEYPNFKLFKEVSYKNTNIPFKVKSVDGYAMLFNVKKVYVNLS